MLRQLFYVSRATSALGDKDVKDILRVSQRNNQRSDLTGCLMCSGRYFAQTLEGDCDALEELTKRIALDARHEDLRVIVDREVRTRLYPAWSMGFLYQLDLADELEALFNSVTPSNERANQLMELMRADSVMGTL
jgi:Sensors of blue-light using FAD